MLPAIIHTETGIQLTIPASSTGLPCTAYRAIHALELPLTLVISVEC
jgi:hypothetical protein